MSPRSQSLRRWPSRNFLAELEAQSEERYTLDDLARRERGLRRAYRQVQLIGRTLQARTGGPDWVRFSDARTFFQSVLFEVGFNLGYENGFVAGRQSASPVVGAALGRGVDQLRMELRRLLVRTTVPPEGRLEVALELAWALARSP